jgi:hypothetical protein
VLLIVKSTRLLKLESPRRRTILYKPGDGTLQVHEIPGGLMCTIVFLSPLAFECGSLPLRQYYLKKARKERRIVKKTTATKNSNKKQQQKTATKNSNISCFFKLYLLRCERLLFERSLVMSETLEDQPYSKPFLELLGNVLPQSIPQ